MAAVFLQADPTDKVVSHTTFMAGINVFAYYREDKPNPFVEDVEPGHLKLLFLLHGREQSVASVTELLARKVLEEYYKADQEIPLIVFCWDHRNHGSRLVEPQRNLTWAEGNDNHGLDMLSIISAAVEELKLIVDYLPAALPLFARFKVQKVVSGVSMGGHATIRSVAKYPELWDGAIPIVGCFDLSSLMLNRLSNFGEANLFTWSYDDIRKQIDDKYYTEYLFQITARDDRKVLENYGTTGVKTLALFGENDPLVIPKYSSSFLQKMGTQFRNRDQIDFNSTFQAINYPATHEVTDSMVIDMAKWLQALK
jgi:alpha-beta hydrolase superfamily lysophospholipase